MTEDIAVRPTHALLRPVASPADVLAVQAEVNTLIVQALEEGRDYGTSPGTKTPSLLKPGAERINQAFGTYPRYAVAEKEVDHHVEIAWIKRRWKWGQQRGEKIWTEERGTSLGLYRYLIRCELVLRSSGEVVGDGMGSASTLEAKYIDRPRDLENTVLKMAQKRAMVAATLNAYALSDRFTQDMEDNHANIESMNRPEPTPPPAVNLASDKQIEALTELASDPLLPGDKRGAITAALDRELTARQAGALIGKARKILEAASKDAEPPPPPDDPPVEEPPPWEQPPPGGE